MIETDKHGFIIRTQYPQFWADKIRDVENVYSVDDVTNDGFCVTVLKKHNLKLVGESIIAMLNDTEIEISETVAKLKHALTTI
ncbi:MAG: hypothetical protein GY928_33850 [Colwellia sp.]|nr:hypothetical protein [Colwellia sp.]